ncbi:hypothetical protein CDD80_448 [Ophiocordyceps camponoti-rufipedis]|uniref:Phosphatidate phosphatase APP1 catalytic domain-containing protein n=1 Tax=Ophiocordyceps camponoti-rufipedis TaxID=2004952 RepID=A0A2C5YEF3_9HYPO|nr:hypothetical protein CDD80_448 [Ophiocordyceps camponoti-rufipedis]
MKVSSWLLLPRLERKMCNIGIEYETGGNIFRSVSTLLRWSVRDATWPRKPPLANFKLAPFRIPGLGQRLVRFCLPRHLRDQYRRHLVDFHLDTVPRIKHGIQSRIYRLIVHRHRRRLLAAVGHHKNRLSLGLSKRQSAGHGPSRAPMPTLGSLTAGYMPGAGDNGPQETRVERAERGYRRRKLAEMAGSLYRSGQQAVTDIRESYAQVRARGLDDETLIQSGSPHIPGSFPDVAITSQGDEQMVLFPSYAKRHARKDWSQQTADAGEEHFWRQEWERHEDEKALVDVDVRGWIYSPQVGPMTKRNRMLIGLARQLSGVPAPSKPDTQQQQQQLQQSPTGRPLALEERVEQERVAQEAALIEQRGRQQSRLAQAGGRLSSSSRTRESLARTRSSLSATRQPSSELGEAELILANANLMARVAPFLTSPRAALPMTIFFYNDVESQSRTVATNDAGHFSIRAQLDFVPTGVRVLANERLSAMQDVEVLEPYGVSVISDVDDTVKHSNISAGAREMFRNTFVRDLGDLKVEGVEEWYRGMEAQGASFHYCSNSPWQLFPVLASFFKLGGLPPGSLHLKHYSGMLQGIFEPVAERKRATLNDLLADFPSRKFLLVGDSGEADLEVYTELALANPGRVLAVFIRDVTTPPADKAFFDSAAPELKMASLTLDEVRSEGKPLRKPLNGISDQGSKTMSVSLMPDDGKSGRKLPTDAGTSAIKTGVTGPATGILIDLDFDTEAEKPTISKSNSAPLEAKHQHLNPHPSNPHP